MDSSFAILKEFTKTTVALAKVAERLMWDYETTMPKGGVGDRAEETAAIEGIIHERKGSKQLGDLISAVDKDKLSPIELREYTLINREHNRATKIPQDLAVEISRQVPLTHSAWNKARLENDFNGFAPQLGNIISLKRQEADAIRSGTDMTRYDALLQDYEPDTTSDEISAVFNEMRPRLVTLREAVLQAEPAPVLKGDFTLQKQKMFCDEIAKVFSYDMSRGRIDTSVHAFSAGTGNDVRITTSYDKADPLGCVYTIMHEVGHATYDQNIHPDYNFTILGCGVSMGVHESQSRIYENQFGRSEEFTSWLFGRICDVFGELNINNERDFYRTVNNVKNGFIRTESDELQYNLHVMMRFDLERAMINGELDVSDLENAWNSRFESDFGFEIPNAKLGVLQDVHWSEGLLGYFPTYSLGNVYAGCLFEAIQKDVPNMGQALSKGDLSSVIHWLKENVQVHGSAKAARDVISQASGQPISADPLMNYIEHKFKDLYNL